MSDKARQRRAKLAKELGVSRRAAGSIIAQKRAKLAGVDTSICGAVGARLGGKDEEFLRICLESIRDGEAVTIFGGPGATKVARDRLRAMGATEQQLELLVVRELGSARPS